MLLPQLVNRLTIALNFDTVNGVNHYSANIVFICISSRLNQRMKDIKLFSSLITGLQIMIINKL